MESNRSCAVGIAIVLITATTSIAGVRADLSGDAVVDFATTMDMPFMTVGNLDNAPDYTGFGEVDYEYAVGKFEVTAGQYTEFLNAVAATDTYGLYSQYMNADVSFLGCNIKRNGPSGNYSYSVAPDWEDRPVNYVSSGDAARFVNWLSNGMPTGAQDLTTTEDGSYFLNGMTTEAAFLPLTRNADASYVIPSEDEWYKAAYHANDMTDYYFDYPTSSDVFPSNDLIDPDPGNVTNTFGDGFGHGGYTTGSPYYRTEVGEFENSGSPYGTFDMGGNVWEWNEVQTDRNESGVPGSRGLRGGCFRNGGFGAGFYLHTTYPEYHATYEFCDVGFRVAQVPEPATMSLLTLGAVTLLRRKR